MLFGNNRTIKNCYGQKNRELFANMSYISQLHVLSGNVQLFSNNNNPAYRTITECTSNTDDSTSGGPVFFVGDNDYGPSGNCINFGDNGGAQSFFKRKTRIAAEYNWIRPVANLINWGSSKVISFSNDSVGCFEMDRWTQPINFFNYGKTERFWSLEKTDKECLLFNNSILGSKAFGGAKDSAGYYSIPNDKLTDSAFMRSLMGDSAEQDFIFEDGFYPRLRHMDERPGRLSASPILLYPGENVDDVKNPFYVDTNYGVRWISLSEGLVDIVGDSGYVRMPVAKDSVVRIEAWKEEFSKHVYLTIRGRSFINEDLGYDTVCPGDSVRMERTYARQAGWNYEVVWGDGNDATPDTVYRLYLHHHPTYREEVCRVAVERDSLPYIHGGDTIWRFGDTELRRYLTVHGCDSIQYLRLDTLYVHRERHFHDTLEGCVGDTLRWRGRTISQPGAYADTVRDPYRGGTDSIYHLRADIYPSHSQSYTDSCYIEELPHTVGGRPMADFGQRTGHYLTAHGCDSTVSYELLRRWRHYRVQVKVRGEGVSDVTDTTLREDGFLWITLTATPCHRLDSLRVDGRDVPPQSRCLLENLEGDCMVEAVFAARPSAGELELEVCADSLPVYYSGVPYGEGLHEVRLSTAEGCDSVLRLRVSGRENTAMISVLDTIAPLCGESEIRFTYAVEAGSPRRLRVAFDDAARASGFRDTALAVGGGGGKVILPLPENVAPDRYGLCLYQTDGAGCSAQAGSLTFEARYPSGVIVQKWDDVLSVLSPEYNGGYEFSGYQWYRNGEALAGATGPYYTTGEYLRTGDEYAVLLERASDGLRLLSCVYKARRAPGESLLHIVPNPSRGGEEVLVTVAGKPESSGYMEVYEGTGRRVYRGRFEGGTHVLVGFRIPGTYLVRAVSEDGKWTASGKMVIM